MDASEKKNTPSALQKEALYAWGIAALLLIIARLASGAIAWLDANLAFVAALIFVLVPGYFLRKRGEHESSYGLGFEDWRPGLVWGLGLTLLTVLLFSPAYHLWETRIEQRAAHPSIQHYKQLGMTWYGAPQHLDDGKVHLWTWGQQSYLAWTPPRGDWSLTVTPEPPGTLYLNAADFGAGKGSPRLALEGASPRRIVEVVHLSGANSLYIEAIAGGQHLVEGAVLAGASAQPAGHEEAEGTRIPLGYGWLVHLLLTHLILVAVPEEFFFRGYVQERLHQAWGRKAFYVFGLPLTWSIVASSVLFALVHLISTVQLTRLSVFFPSLLFGALRERTGGIAASVVYHAACNMLVVLLGVHYF